MIVTPYLFFNGKCAEALAFYTKALGAQLRFQMRYDEMPEKPDPSRVPPGSEHLICHASFIIGETEIMASDGCAAQPAQFAGFSLSLQPTSADEAHRLFDLLADGGTVTMPMGKTFFSPAFGMVADRFGVGWMVYVPQPM